MHQSGPGGRHRAAPAAPATTGQIAALWSAVSVVLRTLESRLRYYDDRPEDARLGEQLTLVPVMHEWAWLTDVETKTLTGLLLHFEALSVAGDSDETATAVITYTREMIRSRLRAVLI